MVALDEELLGSNVLAPRRTRWFLDEGQCACVVTPKDGDILGNPHFCELKEPPVLLPEPRIKFILTLVGEGDNR